MPATSDLAKRLANDLINVGRLLGFEASAEEPIRGGSDFRIDIFWKMKMPDSSPFPIINIASIEIQYSESNSSISHNIFKVGKTLHPAMHIVISYYKLSDDYKENILKPNYPISGLVVCDGEERVRSLNLWITKFLISNKEEGKLEIEGKKIKEFAISQLPNRNASEIEGKIRETFRSEIEEILVPPEITSLANMLLEMKNEDYGREIIDKVFENFIKLIQSKMKDYNIKHISIPTRLLLPNPKIEPRSAQLGLKLGDSIEINDDKVIIRDKDDYPLELSINGGNIFVETSYEIVCEESLTSYNIKKFLIDASNIIKDQIYKYSISNEEKRVLKDIIESIRDHID